MTDFVLRQPTTMRDLIRNNEATIFNDIVANPATLATDVATRTTLAQTLVNGVLEMLVQQGIIMRGQTTTGATWYYWSVSAWATTKINNRVAVRTWIANPVNDGKRISQMAIDVGIHEAIAIELAYLVQKEGGVELSEN